MTPNNVTPLRAPVDYPVIGARFVHPQTDWPRSGPARHIVIGAMPAARAATPYGLSLLRVSGAAGISIAVFALVYFGGQLVRGWLS